jgi:choline dehydrogenase-like flavoprotein
VLAARLTEDPDVRVLVVEAGLPDTEPTIHASPAWPTLWLSRYDWGYFSEPEPALHGRKVFLPRGKVVGGTSSINAMIYMRGNRLDYDGWAAAGATGWSYADVLPYFRKAEDNERGESEWHGVGGPLSVSDPHYRHPVMLGMLDAAMQAGHPFNDDLNGATQDGVGLYQSTQRGGMRCSAADAYLHPALDRPGLELLTGALVHRLVLDGTAVRGLVLDVGGEPREIRAEREVILSAGSYNTPQLLMLSGIGRPADLAPFGIAPVVDLPVGENLQDHILVQLAYLTDVESLIAANTPENLELLEKEHRGMLSSNGAEMGGFLRSRAGLDAPDIQIHGAPVLFTEHGLGVPYDHGYSVGPTLLTPTSRGKVSLRSPVPGTAPRILHNHFGTEEDRAAMLSGLRMVLDITAQPAVRAHQRGEPVNVPASDSDADLMAWLEREVFSVFHPVGTCAIGSVVDPELRVYGVENLRVVDASVMPTVTRGNTNAPTIMIAEKAADAIRGRAPLPRASEPASEPAATTSG